MRTTALLCRAKVLQEIGDFDQALNDVNQSIGICPDEVAYFVRATIYDSMGEPARAIDDYTRADRIVAGQAHVLLARAEAFERLGNMDEAQRDRKHAEQVMGADRSLREVKEFIARLSRQGVYLRLSRNGASIVFDGFPMRDGDLPDLSA
jgi:tetratricopeptide (TPR) repeat protein